MTLTRELVRLIRNKPVDDTDLRQTSLFELDTLACALGALKTEPARILAVVAPPQHADITRRTFYFGGLSHILELDDLHRSSVTHPGCVVIPAAWATAESLNAGGRAFLTAVLAGYEACARIGMAVGKAHYRVWHNTSTCGLPSAPPRRQRRCSDSTRTNPSGRSAMPARSRAAYGSFWPRAP